MHRLTPALLLVGTFLTIGCGKDSGDSSATTESNDHGDHGDDGDDGGGSEGDVVNGEAVYTASCSGCHGANGEGGTGTAMTEAIPGQTASQIATIAMEGSGTMPPILADATDAADVGAYAVATWGP